MINNTTITSIKIIKKDNPRSQTNKCCLSKWLFICAAWVLFWFAIIRRFHCWWYSWRFSWLTQLQLQLFQFSWHSHLGETLKCGSQAGHDWQDVHVPQNQERKLPNDPVGNVLTIINNKTSDETPRVMKQTQYKWRPTKEKNDLKHDSPNTIWYDNVLKWKVKSEIEEEKKYI